MCFVIWLLQKPYYWNYFLKDLLVVRLKRLCFLAGCCCLVAKSVRLCNPMDCSPLGSSVHGISQARILEWIACSTSYWTHLFLDHFSLNQPDGMSPASIIFPHVWKEPALTILRSGGQRSYIWRRLCTFSPTHFFLWTLHFFFNATDHILLCIQGIAGHPFPTTGNS